MARIRTIKPEFWVSESVGRLSRDARLLFIALWSLADDSGRLRGGLAYLSGAAFPYDMDAREQISRWIDELVGAGMVRTYAGPDANRYLDIPNWRKHQKIDKPSASKIPSFEEGSPTPRESSPNPREDSWEDQGSGIRDQGEDQGTSPNLREVMADSPPPGDIDPESRWPYVRKQPWAVKLQAAGTGIGKGSWLRWEGLCKRFTVPAVVTMAESLPSCDRNPWTVEAALEELSKGKHAKGQARGKATVIDQIITRLGWREAAKAAAALGVGGKPVESEGMMRDMLDGNPELCEDLRKLALEPTKAPA